MDSQTLSCDDSTSSFLSTLNYNWDKLVLQHCSNSMESCLVGQYIYIYISEHFMIEMLSQTSSFLLLWFSRYRCEEKGNNLLFQLHRTPFRKLKIYYLSTTGEPAS